MFVIPPGEVECTEQQTKQVWALKSWLYWLRVAYKSWLSTIHEHLLWAGLVSGTADVHINIWNRGKAVLVLYMDMTILSQRRDVTDFLVHQTKRFELSDFGEASYAVCLTVSRDATIGSIGLPQKAPARDLLECFHILASHDTRRCVPASSHGISDALENMNNS